MKMNILIILTFVLIWSSCEEKINWKVKESSRRLVVEAGLTDELKYHEVKLSISSSYFDSSLPETVSRAEVSITDGERTIEFEESPANSGIYKTIEKVKGEIGKTYTLSIDLEKEIADVRNYTATAKMNRALPVDSIVPIFFPNSNWSENADDDDDADDSQTKKYILYLAVYGQEPNPVGDYYYANLFRNDSLMTKSIFDVVLLHDEMGGFNGKNVFPIYIYTDTFVEAMDTIAVELHSTSETYIDYIYNMDEVTDGADAFGMSGPPANVKGNISDKAFGFFSVSAVKRSHAYLLPRYHEVDKPGTDEPTSSVAKIINSFR